MTEAKIILKVGICCLLILIVSMVSTTIFVNAKSDYIIAVGVALVFIAMYTAYRILKSAYVSLSDNKTNINYEESNDTV